MLLLIKTQVDESCLGMMKGAFDGALAPISAANSTLQSMGFSTIWNAVKSDCTSVSSYLKIANTPGSRNIDDQVPIPNNLTTAQRQSSYSAVCNAATSAVGQNAIQADIQATTANSLAISQTFQNILNKLTFIDSQNLNNGVRFAPKWQAIAQNWTNILWASRTTASNTAAYCTEFTTVIMPFVANLTGPIPASLSVQVLTQYSDMASSLGDAAQATSQAFTALNDSINAFTSTFQTFALKQQQADQQMITQLTGNIKSLQSQIASYNIKIAAVSAALGVTVLGTAAGVTAFPVFAPIIALVGLFAAAGEAAALGVLEHDLSNAKNQLASDQNQVTALQNQLAQIAAANSTLHSIAASTQTMGQQLEGFSAVWAAVKSDCTAVSQYLTFANTPLARAIPQIFWGTINNVHCVYEGIAIGLQNYAIGITNSGIPPPSKRGLGGPANFAETLRADVQALVASARAKAEA
ncbi:hypothetical protein B0H17DRAFT_1213399 [Mycena rosella]|uniref:Uncharacterized protein n=1 Tax=Mycena rosella TaxID=1033263 RepID=A0AAD7CQ79_MYCRO|nr:hypothetical protein B0H17DRAFT_1213399 [Mycena rosella]